MVFEQGRQRRPGPGRRSARSRSADDALRGIRRGARRHGAARPVARSRPSSGGGARARSSARTRDRGDADERASPSGARAVQRKSDPTGMIIGIGVAVVLIGIAYRSSTRASSRARGRVSSAETAYDRAERGMETDAVASRVAFQAQGEPTPDREPARPGRRAPRGPLDKRLDRVDDGPQRPGDQVARRSPQGHETLRRHGESSPCSPLREALKWFMGEFPNADPRTPGSRGCSRAPEVAELGSPMTIEDLRVDVWGSVEKAPKDFIDAERSIDRFVAAALTPRRRGGGDPARRDAYGRARALRQDARQRDGLGGQAALVNYNAGLAMDDLIKIMVTCNDSGLQEDCAPRSCSRS